MTIKTNTKSTLNQLYTVQQVQGLLGLSYRQVLLMIKTGEIPGYKISERAYRIRANDLDSFIESKRVQVAHL